MAEEGLGLCLWSVMLNVEREKSVGCLGELRER